MLHDQGQFEDLKRANEWVKDSGLPEAIRDMKVIENEIEDRKKKLKGTKAKIERLMRGGNL